MGFRIFIHRYLRLKEFSPLLHKQRKEEKCMIKAQIYILLDGKLLILLEFEIDIRMIKSITIVLFYIINMHD
jgi:hypothetical protein